MPKSPLKEKPLHNPGETLEHEIEDLKNEKYATNALGLSFLFALALMEWYRWFFDVAVNPVVMTVIALIGSPFFIYRLVKLRRELVPLKLGLAGEKEVGQQLEHLRELGAKVLHDIPFNGFNIDHVVIHGSGIYVIETKTYSKPDKGETKIQYDGKALYFSGGIERDAPLIQVKAASKSLQQLLRESTGITFDIQPVLAFPGWYAQSTDEALKSDVCILNPQMLPSLLRKRKQQIENDKVHMVTLHLSQYVKAYKRQ